jgi:hypothetical protein
VARRAIALLQLEQVVVAVARLGAEPAARHQQVVREQVRQRLAGHAARLARLDAQPLEQLDLEVLADLVCHRPLMPLFRRLRTQIDLLAALGTLGPAALLLALVEADHHAQMPLRQVNGVDRRRLHPRGVEQLLHHLVHDGDDVFAQQVVVHGDTFAYVTAPSCSPP